MKDIDQLAEIFMRVAEKQQVCIRQSRTMLAGFKALGERDIDYMDSYMDGLWDFMEAGDETEMLQRDYLAYISTFNPKEGRRRIKDLEEHLGYWTPVAIAAAYVARDLHKGQKDKGDNDYFNSHLLVVGSNGHTWKEKVVGFLHDAAEDKDCSEEEVMESVRRKLETLAASIDKEWIDEFELMPFPNGTIFFPSDEDWNEIRAALHTLNHHHAVNRTDYIQGIKRNELALRVKLNDLRSNMDLTRIPQPTSKDMERIERYKTEYAELMERFRELVDKEKDKDASCRKKVNNL